MTYLKLYGKTFLYTILSLLISLLFITLFYYFNFINENIYKILKLLILIINIFISSFLLGKKASSKGYLEGIKLSTLIIIFFFILTLLFNEPFKFRIILYYFILFITATFGSMLGINKKKIKD